MADGQVLIDSKLDVGGIDKGIAELRKEFNKLSKEVSKVAKEIESGLKNIDVDNVADGMSESFETEGEQIEQAVEQAADSVEKSADQMADAMEDSAEEQSDSMKKAWDKTEDEAKTGSRKVQDDIDDIGDEAKETGNEIESSLGKAFSGLASKIGGIMATAFAFEELVEFGKEAINLGSDLAEVQNVVDTTFGDASGVIDDFARGAIKNFGLSELSAKQFSSTMGAMLKSMGGFDDKQIVEMSTALAGLAGDMASFYNLDAQEAFDKLRSGISGETEPLKQLGINLSVANLEAFALANGIKKSYDKMTEQEKALLRYNYLLKATADAQGDFTRTQDSWANQTRILTEEFNSLKGTLGQGLINVLNPLVTSINGKLMPVLHGLADEFLNLTETFDWNDLIGDVDFGPISASLSNFGGKCAELAEVIGSGLKWAWDNVLVPFGKWSINAGLPALMDALGGAFDALASTLQWLEPLALEIWNNFLQPLASWTGGAIVSILKAIGDAFTFLAEGFDKLSMDSITWFMESMNLAGQYAQTGMIDPIKTGLDEIAVKEAETFNQMSEDAQAGTAAAGAAGVATIQGTMDAMDTIVEAEQEHIAATSEAVVAGNKQILDGVTSNSTASNAAIVADAANTGTQIASSYTDAANAAITTAFTPMEESGTATAEATSEAFDDAANTMRAAWADMGPWFDANVATPIKTSMEGISSTMSSKWSEMKANTASAWAEMVATVQQSVQQMQSSINSITGKTVYVNVEKTGSGANMVAASAGYNGLAYTPASFDITPQIPYLATGAVIPPRAPFMAMLGDQRNGKNLEAPEGLIRKIIQEEMGSIEVSTTVNFAGTLAQFVRMLFPEIKSEARRRGNSIAKEVIE